MLHILHITNCYYPLVGGQTTHVVNLLESLAKLKGVKISLLVPVRSNQKREPKTEKVNNYTVHRIYYKDSESLILRLLRITVAVYRGVLKIQKQIPVHIIHQHDFRATKLGAVLAARMTGIPMAWTNHKSVFFEPYNSLYRNILSMSFFQPDGIIIVHKHLAKLFENSRFSRSIVKYIPNGVNPTMFQNKSATENDISGKKEISIFFPQRVHESKDPLTFAKAIYQVMNANNDINLKVRIAGSGKSLITDDYLIEEIKKLLHREIQTDQVEILGEVPHSEMADYYGNSDIVIITLTKETENIAVFETWASEIALIATDQLNENGYAVHGKNCWLVPPKSPEKLAAAIVKLSKDKALRCRLGTNGRRLVVERFTWENTAIKTLDFYNELLEQSNKSGSH